MSRSLGSRLAAKSCIQRLCENSFDFGTGQAVANSGKLDCVKVLWFATIFGDLDLPDLLTFLGTGKIDKEYLVEATFAKKFQEEVGRCRWPWRPQRPCRSSPVTNSGMIQRPAPKCRRRWNRRILLPPNPFSSSSIQRTQGEMASAVAIADRRLDSDWPTSEPNSFPASNRSRGIPKTLAVAFAVRDLPVPGMPRISRPLGVGRP